MILILLAVTFVSLFFNLFLISVNRELTVLIKNANISLEKSIKNFNDLYECTQTLLQRR